MLHLATADAAATPLHTAFLDADTFCESEYQALCEVVAATHIGGDLLPTVQTAVTNAYMTKQERWQAEARRLLKEFGLLPDGPAAIRLA